MLFLVDCFLLFLSLPFGFIVRTAGRTSTWAPVAIVVGIRFVNGFYLRSVSTAPLVNSFKERSPPCIGPESLRVRANNKRTPKNSLVSHLQGERNLSGDHHLASYLWNIGDGNGVWNIVFERTISSNRGNSQPRCHSRQCYLAERRHGSRERSDVCMPVGALRAKSSYKPNRGTPSA
ncbi:hypothetical protein CISG_05643 [Coccidioides immitis RMSCC 3703]|uniref:Uncharacterized protein n=2 Tax=Coccidioides immitis TaxID=5501 RepID=A0A0J8QXN6_COCIT|nr:hypothetical protein CIRG_00520 [Coccidioides immitis RMSCC 2394]KMU76810.1 hypothetical protein CISG_05643 [Coccidioides immitis RMSCC 3703]